MSALAEALLASQRAALAATQRAYLAGAIDADADVIDTMNRIGCTDSVEQTQYLAALDTLREFGVQAPATNGATTPKEDRPASEAQLKLLRRLAEEKGTMAPDGPLTSAQASKAISELKAGTYNADTYTAPF